MILSFDIRQIMTTISPSLHDHFIHLPSALEEVIAHALTPGGGFGITGIPTGFTDLDRMTGGLHPGQLIVVGTRPSVGGTTFVTNIGAHIAIECNLPVAYFSMDNPSFLLVQNMLCSTGRINRYRFRTGQLNDEEKRQMTERQHKMQNAPLFIDDTPRLTIDDLCQRAHSIKEQTNLGLVIIDTLQLIQMESPNEGNKSRAQISARLSLLSKELDCPVIVTSQVNRAVERRKDKRPQLLDLPAAERIEQYADLVLFLYRDEIYDPDSPDTGLAEVIISRQTKIGPTGTLMLRFNNQCVRFEDYRS